LYYRKVFKAKRANNTISTKGKEPVFGVPPPEYEPQMDDLNCKLISLKRKSTPITDAHLRRSKRGGTHKDGFKLGSPITTRSKSKGKGKKSAPNLDKHHQPVDFPDLVATDKMVNLDITFPEIPVSELQKVTTERCAIHPMEVAEDLLLADERRSSNNNQ
jgi:hypothetical protein